MTINLDKEQLALIQEALLRYQTTASAFSYSDIQRLSEHLEDEAKSQESP